jgi:hypothetical protein
MSERRERTSPYHLVFGAESVDETLFPPIAEEAAAREHPLDDPDHFLFLTGVGRLLHAIAGDPEQADAPEDVDVGPGSGGGSGPDSGGGDEGGRGETFKQHGRLLYHAFHHWRAGRVEVEIGEDLLRSLLDDPPTVGDWALTTPAAAGYLRLPVNLVWAAPAPGLRPEPADGVFWALMGEDAEVKALHLLMALGVRADRPGFSVVSASGVTDDEPHWADLDARPGGQDFATTLPGGDLDRLYSIETAGELLRLASLCFHHLDRDRG